MSPAKQAIKACEIIIQRPTKMEIKDIVDDINSFRDEAFMIQYHDAELLVDLLWPKRVTHVVFNEQNEAS